jgi:hypothetical protein
LSNSEKKISGRGAVDRIPLPEVVSVLAHESDFDPPSKGGWKVF